MDGIIKAHNAKILRKEDGNTGKDMKSCNCRDKSACPVGNKCLKFNVVYKATDEYEDKTEHYIGMTENTFKTRYTLHKSSLKHNKNRKQTELSNLIWSLKDNNKPLQTFMAQPYKPGKRTCNLCLCEKYHILLQPHLINRKSELLNKCPHRLKYLAYNYKA